MYIRLKNKFQKSLTSFYSCSLILIKPFYFDIIADSDAVARNNTGYPLSPKQTSCKTIIWCHRILTLIESTYRRVTTPQGSLVTFV